MSNPTLAEDTDQSAAWEQSAFLALFCAATVQLGVFALLTLNQPIIDLWGFRGPQTASIVPYMLRDGAWLVNIVPIFGEPWVVPLEFPLYQWCVALLVAITGTPIDPVGRLINVAFAVACLWPMLVLAREMRMGRGVALLAGALWLAAPVVVFFGRSFLIETSVVFLSLSWLAFYIRFLNWRSARTFTACLAFGALAGLAKPTALAGFWAVGFAYTCAVVFEERRASRLRIAPLAGAGLTVLLPAMAFLLWSRFADHYMAANPLSTLLRFQNENLVRWYFGRLDDRIGAMLWDWAVYQRALPEGPGIAWLSAVYGLIRLGPKNRYFWIAAVLIVGWLGSFALFPRLHMYHHYYQVENVLLILMAVAVVVAGLFESSRRIEAAAVLALIVGGQAWSLYSGMYFRIMTDDLRKHPYYLAGMELKARTAPDSVIVVFGTGYGADVPYFSDRRGIVPANWFPPAEVRRVVIDERARWFGGRKLGAVVDCAVYDNQRIDPELAPIRDALKQELGGATSAVEGKFYGATVTPPRCEITLPR